MKKSDLPSRQVKLDSEDMKRATSLSRNAADALRELEHLISSQLEGAELDSERDRPKFALTILDNDSHIISDGGEYCGVYDESAGVCRDCTWFEWGLAISGSVLWVAP